MSNGARVVTFNINYKQVLQEQVRLVEQEKAKQLENEGKSENHFKLPLFIVLI